MTTLMHDMQYRMQCGCQQSSYNQPPHTSFYLGTEAQLPARPDIKLNNTPPEPINGRLVNKSDVVYFNNLTHFTGAVKHMGDNLTGGGDGDDEQIVIDLNRLPPEYDRVVLVVNIYQAYTRNQHFGMINNAFIRLVNMANGQEMLRYNLTENYGGMTAMIFGEIYRHAGEWKFNAVGSGTKDGSIGDLAQRYA